MNNHFEEMKVGTILETQEQLFSEKNLLLGILWEGDAQLHTNRPGMEKSSFGAPIVHGNSVTSMAIGQFLKMHFGSAIKVVVSELNVAYLGAVCVGDIIKGIFNIQDHKKHSDNLATLAMTFEVVKNKESAVSKGKMTIEVEGIK